MGGEIDGSHTYSHAGNFTVHVTLSDTVDGQQLSATDSRFRVGR